MPAPTKKQRRDKNVFRIPSTGWREHGVVVENVLVTGILFVVLLAHDIRHGVRCALAATMCVVALLRMLLPLKLSWAEWMATVIALGSGVVMSVLNS